MTSQRFPKPRASRPNDIRNDSKQSKESIRAKRNGNQRRPRRGRSGVVAQETRGTTQH